jgi:hypothetical protein
MPCFGIFGSLADEVDVELEEFVLIYLLLARVVHIRGQPRGGIEGALKPFSRLLRLSYFISSPSLQAQAYYSVQCP